MMKKSVAFGALFATAGGLAGCSGVVTTPAYVEPSYDPALLSYAAKEGPVYTEILGNPYSGNQAQEAERVVTVALEEAQFSGRPLTFVSERPQDYRSPFRVVVLFNPAPAAAANKICGDADQPRRDTDNGDEVSIMMVLCQSSSRVSSVSGYTADAATAEAPGLARLLRQAAAEIFSPQNIQQRNDNGEFEMGDG
jgi:hypothetical protein